MVKDVVTIARYTAIADVSSTLLKILRDNMAGELIDKPEMIGLCCPADENDFKLLLYLYHVEENHDYRNATGMGRTSQGMLTLNLYYLLAAKSSAEIKSKALDENMILGNAMLVLHQNPIISGSDLEGSLAENNDDIKITPVDIEHHAFSSKIKESENLIYKNVVFYKVGPVQIGDSLLTVGRRVISR